MGDRITQLEAKTLPRIEAALAASRSPIVACSFGKDSIVALHLALRFRPVPVLFLRHPKFPQKYTHAYQVVRDWNLELYDLMPSSVIEYQHGEYFEVLDLYRCGPQDNLIMVDGVRRRREDEPEYYCAVTDLLLRPKALMADYPWDLTMLGSREEDPFHLAEQSGPMRPSIAYASTTLLFPLHDWSEQDIWTYIGHYDLPFDRARYVDQNEAANPDKLPTCYACLDTNHLGEMVPCPKRDGTRIQNLARTWEQHDTTRQAILSTLKYCTPEGDGRRVPVT